MALAPCHCLFQFFVLNGQALLPALPALGRCPAWRALQHRELRAADAYCGAGDRAGGGDFVHSFGDTHLYVNHVDQAVLQLTRELRALPKMTLNPDVKRLEDFTFADVLIEATIRTGSDPAPGDQGAIAV